MDMPLLYSFLEVFNSYNNNLRVIIIKAKQNNKKEINKCKYFFDLYIYIFN